MPNDEQAIWLAAGVRTPFVAVFDGPFAQRNSLAIFLSVPVVQAMALSGESSGGGYIVYGQPHDIDGPVNVDNLDGSQGTVITGLPAGANGGFAVGSIDFKASAALTR